MSKRGVRALISELLEDPEKFIQQGRAYTLLNESFDYVSRKDLNILLNHKNIDIKKDGIWLISELGYKAEPLLSDVMNLFNSLKAKTFAINEEDKRFLIAYIMDIIISCANGEQKFHFKNVINELLSTDEIIRSHAVFLISNATAEQIDGSADLVDRRLQDVVKLLQMDDWNEEQISEMINSNDFLEQASAAIIAKRDYSKNPNYIQICLESSIPLIKDFAIEFLEIIRIQNE